MSEFADGAVHIPKIVITGGPCSGKTTGMAMLQSTLKGLGYRVFIAPEAATMFFLAGVQFSDLSDPSMSAAFQRTVLHGQLHLENNLDSYARATGQKAVILCDRGAMDGRAYMDEASFNEVLASADLNASTASAGRYDAVFHLVTAADGAEGHYSLENNETRTESVDYAKVIDKKTQAAWSGHPKHFIIDNSGASFDDKMDKLISTMLHCIGHSAGGSNTSDLSDASTTGIGTRTATGVYHFELDSVTAEDLSGLEDVRSFTVEKFVLHQPGSRQPPILTTLGTHEHAGSIARVELHRQFPKSDDPPHRNRPGIRLDGGSEKYSYR